MKLRVALLLSASAPVCVGQAIFTGSPNPFAANAAGHGQITLNWSVPGVVTTEIHIDAPDGQLFTRASYRGSIVAGGWVTDGMTFYLQDVDSGSPGTTVATFTAHSAQAVGLPADTSVLIPMNNGQQLFYSAAPGPTALQVHLYGPSGPLLANVAPGHGILNTGPWVVDGMRFFLQNVSNGNALTYQYTVATGVATVVATPPRAGDVIFGPTPGIVLDPEGLGLGSTGLYWNAPGSTAVQVRVGAPNGPLFADVGDRGFTDITGWVKDGMRLYLQDNTSGDPASAENTLAISTIDLQVPSVHYLGIHLLGSGVQIYNRDTAGLLGTIVLPNGVQAGLTLTGPDGTLLYASGNDGNIYVLDAMGLIVQSKIALGADFIASPTPTPLTFGHPPVPFVWIKNLVGKDLLLTYPDYVTGNLAVVDPAAGKVVNTIACNCQGAALVYDSFNQTTYINNFALYNYNGGVGLPLETIASNLTLESISVPEFFAGQYISAIVPLVGGAAGRLLIQFTYEYEGMFNQDYTSTQNGIVDLTTGTLVDTGLDPAQTPGLSLDGQSVYTSSNFGTAPAPASSFVASESLFKLTQSGAGLFSSQTATFSLSISNVDSSIMPVAYDGQYLYQYFYDYGQADALSIYLYKASPTTLQPVGPIGFINLTANLIATVGATGASGPFPPATGSYNFCGANEGIGCLQ